jgi:carbon-monoxide dehydrogenase medium subunit
LDAVHDKGDAVEIGALVSLTTLTRSPVIRQWFPALAVAAAAIGCWQVRNLATLGGNLCNASPSADTAPPLLVYGTTAVLSDGMGRRELPLEEFLVGPGKTALVRGEVLVALRMAKPAPGLRTAYVRRAIRRSMDIPLVNVAVGVRLADGRVTEARIVLGAVAPVPFRATEAEKVLVGRPPDAEAFAEAALAAAAAARPITDVRTSAEYRSAMVEVFVRRALVTATQPGGAATTTAGEAAAAGAAA